jgi:hypothetical protein
MQMLDVKVDQYGRVAGRGIHDARVEEFHFVVDECFEIRLRDPVGKSRVISLRDVAQIGFRNVVKGMIISDVFCWRLNNQEKCGTNEAWRVLLGGDYLEADFVEHISMLTGSYTGKFLVLFESSYGGEIAALCSSILIGD